MAGLVIAKQHKRMRTSSLSRTVSAPSIRGLPFVSDPILAREQTWFDEVRFHSLRRPAQYTVLARRFEFLMRQHLLGFYTKEQLLKHYAAVNKCLKKPFNEPDAIYDNFYKTVRNKPLNRAYLSYAESALVRLKKSPSHYVPRWTLTDDAPLLSQIEALYQTLERDMLEQTYGAEVAHYADKIVIDTSALMSTVPAAINTDELPSRYLLAALSMLQAGLDLIEISGFGTSQAQKSTLVSYFNVLSESLGGVSKSSQKQALLNAFYTNVEATLKSLIPAERLKALEVKWFEYNFADVKKSYRKKHTLAQLRQFTRSHLGFKPLVFKRKGGVVEILTPIRTNKPVRLNDKAPQWLCKLVETNFHLDLSILTTQIVEKFIDGSALRNAWNVTVAKENEVGELEVLARFTRSGGISIHNESYEQDKGPHEQTRALADLSDLARADTLIKNNEAYGYRTALMSLMSPATSITAKMRNEYPRTQSMHMVANARSLLMNEAPIYSKGGDYPDEVFESVKAQYFSRQFKSSDLLGEFLRFPSNAKHYTQLSWERMLDAAKLNISHIENKIERHRAELLLMWKILDVNKHQPAVALPTVFDKLAGRLGRKPYYFEWQQAIDVLLGHLEGVAVNVQCKSGKDRTGLICLMVSMLTQHRAEFGAYVPLAVSDADARNFQEACQNAAESGVAAFVAHYGGTSGCMGMMPEGHGTTLREMVCPSISEIVEPQFSMFAQKNRASTDIDYSKRHILSITSAPAARAVVTMPFASNMELETPPTTPAVSRDSTPVSSPELRPQSATILRAKSLGGDLTSAVLTRSNLTSEVPAL